jgi:hypothetical protein
LEVVVEYLQPDRSGVTHHLEAPDHGIQGKAAFARQQPVVARRLNDMIKVDVGVDVRRLPEVRQLHEVDAFRLELVEVIGRPAPCE